MANTALSYQDETLQSKQFESTGVVLQMSRNPKTSNASNKGSSLLASKQMDKNTSSLLDRLTIVDVKPSSSKKKKRRGRRNHSIQRNNEALPEELLLREKQDSVSIIPDCFSNSNSFGKDQGIEANASDNQPPALFTFDIIPTFSEDSPHQAEDDETHGGCSGGNNTTDANIGNEDNISGIFDELEENDAKCVNQMEEKYFMNKDLKNEVDETNKEINMETIAVMSKLELTSRTRTESTALLSEIFSNDTSLRSERESVTTSMPSKLKKDRKDQASLTKENDLQVKASRCISLGLFSMFDSK